MGGVRLCYFLLRESYGAQVALLAIILALLLFPKAVLAQDLEVTTFTLSNGMRVFVHEDHSIPAVTLQTFFRVGSRNERPGTTGVSHFFEHLMFRGTTKHPDQQFDKLIEAQGGRSNAYTHDDITVYIDWIPVGALSLVFELEADRIANLRFDPNVIEAERRVVAQERLRSIESNDEAALSEQLSAIAFTAHPYQWPVIGWPSDIQSWTIADLKHHYALGYSPSNALLVVCGDVTPEQIRQLANRYFAPIKARPIPPPVTIREPEQNGERRLELTRNAALSIIKLAYHIPETKHRDIAALEVLKTALFTGESSRLYKRLVTERQLASNVEGDVTFGIDPALFSITIHLQPNATPEEVEQTIFLELDQMKQTGLQPRELEKAKNGLLADLFREMKTLEGKAQLIGLFEIFYGDFKRLTTIKDEYRQVTNDDVKIVAEKYFTKTNRSVATLRPVSKGNG